MCRTLGFLFSDNKTLANYLRVLTRMIFIDFLFGIVYIYDGSQTTHDPTLRNTLYATAVLFFLCGVALYQLTLHRNMVSHTIAIVLNIVFLCVYFYKIDIEIEREVGSAKTYAMLLSALIIIYKLAKFQIIYTFKNVMKNSPLLDANYAPMPGGQAAIPVAQPVYAAKGYDNGAYTQV